MNPKRLEEIKKKILKLIEQKSQIEKAREQVKRQIMLYKKELYGRI